MAAAFARVNVLTRRSRRCVMAVQFTGHPSTMDELLTEAESE